MAKVERASDRWLFWCPGCDQHHGPSDNWKFNNDLEKPTFNPSILVRWHQNGPDGLGGKDMICHSFVTDGKIRFLGDCTHKLAGQTVDIPNIE